MQGFISDPQPYGTGSLSSCSVTQVINTIKKEEDQEEDQVNSFDSPMDNMLAAQATTWPPLLTLILETLHLVKSIQSYHPFLYPIPVLLPRLWPPPSFLPPSVHPQTAPDDSMRSASAKCGNRYMYL